MKHSSSAILFTALLAVSLPADARVQANADAPKAVCPPTPAQVSVRWEIVSVPQADWNKIAAQGNRVAAIRQGHYPTVSGPTVTTTDGVEASLSLQTPLPFGPPEKRGFVTVGTQTKVKPSINQDGTITLQFSLRDTELAGPAASPNDPPPTATTALSSTRTLASNVTYILGSQIISNSKRLPVILLAATVKTGK